MDCGQVFGWEKEDAAYWGIIKDTCVGLHQEGDSVSFFSVRDLEPSDIITYLGLDDDMDAILHSIAVDTFMERAVSCARGLRLLKQDPWPCLCSYILSANNRVARIDALVKAIAREFGKGHAVGDRTVYSLPTPCVLAGCVESGLRACGVGFRAPYLLGAARLLADGTVDFDDIDKMSYQEGREVLKTIPGVGDKIADCVLLFAFSKYEAFPVDVWIKRAMQKIYFDSRDVSLNEIREFGRQRFGRYAGYAQEYIYYYARIEGLN
jgi:N-glycosylase/DNA lyase